MIQFTSRITDHINGLPRLGSSNIDDNASIVPDVQPEIPPKTSAELPPQGWTQTSFGVVDRKMACPPGKVYDLWNLWWLGSDTSKIPPLRTLNMRDFKTRRDQANFAKLTCVVNAIISLSKTSVASIVSMPVPERIQLFETAFAGLGKHLIDPNDEKKMSKLTGLTHHTVYDTIKKSKSK
ncbi:unnamed protein product [Aphanomyces euteiches]